MSASININEQSLINLVNDIKPGKRGDKVNPHKYILLLTLIRIFDNLPIHENKFYFYELEPVFMKLFLKYCSDLQPYSNMLEYPFYHLKSSGFWYLKIIKGMETKFSDYEKLRLTKNRLYETVEYAYLVDDVYNNMLSKINRGVMESIIISKLTNKVVYNDANDDELIIKDAESLYEHENAAIEAIKRYINNNSFGNLINNILIYDKQSNNYYEYDIILVAHSGIYVVELKHWSGNIQIADYNWVINHALYRSDPHKINSFKCKLLKGIYQHQFRAYPDIWVESVVVLTNPDAEVQGTDLPNIALQQRRSKASFASLNDFHDYIKKRERLGNERLLSDQQISLIINYLQSLNSPQNRNNRYSIPGYETVEYLVQTPERIELVARSLGGKGKGLKRFRVFRPPVNVSPIEKKRFMKKAYNTLDSVSEIGEHPNILRVWVNQDEEGNVVESSDWSETGTLRDLLVQQSELLPLDRGMKICLGIAEALAAAHQQEVIHRAVKPENILIMNDIPKLMNFDLAYQIEDNRLTVIADAGKIKDDGYVAPEVLAGKDIDESTDLFALSVIACEILGGIKPFSTVKQFLAQGEQFLGEYWLELAEHGVPDNTLDVLKQLLVIDRSGRLHDINCVLAAFNPQNKTLVEHGVPNAILASGSTYDIYEIEDFIGQGMGTQVYKAIYRSLNPGQGMVTVAIKMFDREIPRERFDREVYITSSIRSSYVVQCDNRYGYWQNDRFFMVLNYIEGHSLRNYIGQSESEMFRTIALCLFEALRAFHEHGDDEGNLHPLVHSDIKPENIMITPDHKAVLIDCGIAGEPRFDIFQGSIGYFPPDNISDEEMYFNESGDLFALGVTLWEYLFGIKPYENPVVGDRPVIPNNDIFPVLNAWLLKAVATEAKNRFFSIEEMAAEFNAALAPDTKESIVDESDGMVTANVSIAEPFMDRELYTDTEALIEGEFQYNNFVSYLNTLSNTSANNENATAESQIGNRFFERIRVTNPLSEYLYEQLIIKKQSIVLTGNAGDGKTTLAAEVFKLITGVEAKTLAKEEDIVEYSVKIIKDLSEIEADRRVSLLADTIASENFQYLLVSNTGTLLKTYQELKVGDPDSISELLKALAADSPTYIADDRLLVLNLGRMNTIKSAIQVFAKMLDGQNWLMAAQCPIADSCPVLNNVKLLQSNPDLLCDRVDLVYRRLYEYGNRLTMRQMTGHLAYAVTAGYDCQMVRAMSAIQREKSQRGALFINRFFGDDGYDIVPEAEQLLPVRKLRETEFGLELDPGFERELWRNNVGDTNVSIPFYNQLHKLGANNGAEQVKQNAAARLQLRRLLYFLAPLDGGEQKRFLSVFLRSPMLINYMQYVDDYQPGGKKFSEQDRARILQVLQEYFTGIRLPEDREGPIPDIYITLSPREQGGRTQMVLAQIPPQKFSLDLIPKYTVDNTQSMDLVLRVEAVTETLRLELPFLDYVFRRYRGEIAEKLSVFYTQRLEKYKVALLTQYRQENQNLQLLRIADNHSFNRLSIIIENDQLEVRA